MATFENSYLDLMTKLKEDIANDAMMPETVKCQANKELDKLFDILWHYSA